MDNIQELKNHIQSDEAYAFFREDDRISRLILLTLGGSHAYGTNVETSDVDLRGVALNRPEDLLGLSTFEQFVDDKTDTVIYSFTKLVRLLLNCNPNTIEILGCKPEHYLFLSQSGKEFLDNKKLFLSQRAAASFGGYACDQLQRLKNALAHDRMTDEDQQKHIVESMQRSIKAFEIKYKCTGERGVRFYANKTESGVPDIFADIHLDAYPARDFANLLNMTSTVIRSYDKLNHRNRKKDDGHLNKHAMHLIRLYMMCLDILEREEIKTYRDEDEREFLLSIRNGAYMKQDGTYRQEFFDIVNDYEQRLQYAKKNTSLPSEPDMKRVEEFVMDINKRALL